MSAAQCAILHDLSTNITFHLVIAVKCALCVAGACGLGYQWIKKGLRFLVHDNTKVLFHFYYALEVFVAAVFSLQYVFELVRLRFFDCAVLEARTVLLTKGIALCAIFASQHVLTVVSIERLYASLFPAHFERHSSRMWTAVLATVVASSRMRNSASAFRTLSTPILASSFYTMSCLSNNFTLFTDQPVALFYTKMPGNEEPYEVAIRCFRSFISHALSSGQSDESAWEMKSLMVFMSVTNVFSLLILCVDVYLNLIRKASANASLAVSYQRSENRQIVLTILPIEIIGYAFVLTTTVAQTLLGKFFLISTPTWRYVSVELTTLSMLFPLALAICIELRIGRRCRDVVSIEQDVDPFENLRRFWR